MLFRSKFIGALKLDTIKDEKERADKFVEYNVVENVYNLCKTSIVQNAWAKGRELGVHGWVYSIETGIIKDLKVSAFDNSHMGEVFRLK